MNCAEAANLLDAYADGELDLVHNLEVERHLQKCPACAAALDGRRALGAALRDPALYHRPSAGLKERVRAALRPEVTTRSVRRRVPWLPLGVVAAAAALVAMVAWGAVSVLSGPGAEDRVAQEVFSSHIRSLMEGNLLGVKSSDRHTVKPWFDGKMDFALEVKKLDDQGFRLAGGRLDYLDKRTAAALVYYRHKHVINLFVWPADDKTASAPRTLTRRNVHLIHWSDGELTYWAVSDLNEDELWEFVRLVRGS